LLLKPNKTNGLKKASLVRIGKIATIDKALVIGRIGFHLQRQRSWIKSWFRFSE
jgi:hypothetical protein